MAYRQYTKCVDIGSFLGLPWWVDASAAAALAGYLSFSAGAAFVPGALITILSFIIAYCLWWLYQRLICLGGDVCIVGFVLSVEPPEEKKGINKWDTDCSLNLVIPPTLIGATRPEAENSPIYGYLLKQTSETARHNLPFYGNLVVRFPSGKPDPAATELSTCCFHAEFEGGGTYAVLQSCLAALGVATAAAAICSAPILGIFGWIACIVLSIVSALIAFSGAVNALDDQGNPNDVNANLAEIHAAERPDGYGADILAVQGTFVYDSGHEGWNEIHPIKQCQRIGKMTGQGWAEIQIVDGPPIMLQLTMTDLQTYINGWCALLSTANVSTTVANQQLPQNQWTVHPFVDGCDPDSSPVR
jgi:hypothetical protein